MFQKVFEYAGTHKKGLYVSTAVVLISVLTGAPFCAVLLVIAPLIIGEAIDTSFIIFASYVGIGMPDTTVNVKSTCISKMPSQRTFSETANSYLHLLGSTF